MAWILLDVALALAALALLALTALRLWRRVKDLGRTLAVAGEQVAELTAHLEQVGQLDQVGQAADTQSSPSGHATPAAAPPRGVRSGRPS